MGYTTNAPMAGCPLKPVVTYKRLLIFLNLNGSGNFTTGFSTRTPPLLIKSASFTLLGSLRYSPKKATLAYLLSLRYLSTKVIVSCIF
ncbi:MAG: hypothetical protein A3J83_01070 [Elusimicrobia bacterium RIFOXYA2_FULL_40_6]|nr:MAG: hypothetical protein A3J83_01070 [Elusimicrobia bacterium RIFOXYA2_FULL_40_6]